MEGHNLLSTRIPIRGGPCTIRGPSRVSWHSVLMVSRLARSLSRIEVDDSNEMEEEGEAWSSAIDEQQPG